MVKDMILRCDKEITVNQDFDVWIAGKKGSLVIKKLWYRSSGAFYFKVDVRSKSLNLVDELCALGFYMKKEGAFLIFDDERGIRIDFNQKLISYLCSFEDNINYDLRSYLR